MPREQRTGEVFSMSERLGGPVEQAVADMTEIQLIYLFGSQVGAAVGPISDYDLAVLLDGVECWPEVRAQLAYRLAKALETSRVDLVLLNRAPIELAYSVIAQGQVLFQRDLAHRIEYEARVMSLYGDYLPVLRAQQRDILEGNEYAARVQRYRAALGRTERTLGEIGAAQREDAR
jgi:predicted nucleotidyltransferase